MTKSLREGLIGEWLFDGNPNDTVSTNNATVTNATLTTDNLGRSNRAYDCNGTTAYLSADGLASTISGTAGTISILVNMDNFTTQNGLVCFGDTNADTRMHIYSETSGILTIAVKQSGAWKWALDTDASIGGLGNWQMITLVQDGTEAEIYINGVKPAQAFFVSTDKTWWFDDFTGLDNLRFGCRNWNSGGNDAFLDGKIARVRIWDRALTTTEMFQDINEIKENYQGLFDSVTAFYGFRGNAKDSSGNEYDGTVSNATLVSDKLGITNNAYDFNGTNTIITSSIKQINADTPFTAVIRFKMDNTGSGAELFGNTEDRGDTYWIIQRNADNTIRFQQEGVTNTTADNVSSTSTISSGTWYHLVITSSGSAVKIYLDGVDDTSGAGTLSAAGRVTSTADWYIGARKYQDGGGGQDSYIDGQIDYVILLEREWSAAEAKLHYNLSEIKDIYTYIRGGRL